jgi:hypothetical protein
MNEPVAWRIKNKNGEWLYYDEELVGTEPLYAHPVKELTDEEIKALWKPMPDTKTYDSDVLKFARAILRKAKE